MAYRQNILKKKEIRNQRKHEAGLLSECFPRVSGIVINMTYYHKAENPLLMKRTLNVFPESYAYFYMECVIKGCEQGGYDLAPVIKKLVKQRKKTANGEMKCKGRGDNISPDHASISYEITINYAGKTK